MVGHCRSPVGQHIKKICCPCHIAAHSTQIPRPNRDLSTGVHHSQTFPPPTPTQTSPPVPPAQPGPPSSLHQHRLPNPSHAALLNWRRLPSPTGLALPARLQVVPSVIGPSQICRLPQTFFILKLDLTPPPPLFEWCCAHYSPPSPEKRELKIAVENNAREFFWWPKRSTSFCLFFDLLQ
jgi:hypothetical protein